MGIRWKGQQVKEVTSGDLELLAGAANGEWEALMKEMAGMVIWEQVHLLLLQVSRMHTAATIVPPVPQLVVSTVLQARGPCHQGLQARSSMSTEKKMIEEAV